jgi:hypothetical protein
MAKACFEIGKRARCRRLVMEARHNFLRERHLDVARIATGSYILFPLPTVSIGSNDSNSM